MINRILVGICDPEYTTAATMYARAIAQLCGAKVTAIAVTDKQRLRDVGPTPIGAASFVEKLERERFEKNESAIHQSMDALVQGLDEANVPCRVLQPSGNHYAALIEASQYSDLMIFGLRGLFQHGVTEEPPDELIHLVEAGVRPILAVGPEYRQIDRVLIAYSGSVESAKTMRDFANVTLWPDANVNVVHFGRKNAEHEELLAKSRGYLEDHGYHVDTELVEGSAKAELLKYADDRDADLIVVGNSAKSLLRRRIFGETALNAIRQSQLPLFLSQ